MMMTAETDPQDLLYEPKRLTYTENAADALGERRAEDEEAERERERRDRDHDHRQRDQAADDEAAVVVALVGRVERPCQGRHRPRERPQGDGAADGDHHEAAVVRSRHLGQRPPQERDRLGRQDIGEVREQLRHRRRVGQRCEEADDHEERGRDRQERVERHRLGQVDDIVLARAAGRADEDAAVLADAHDARTAMSLLPTQRAANATARTPCPAAASATAAAPNTAASTARRTPPGTSSAALGATTAPQAAAAATGAPMPAAHCGTVAATVWKPQ